MFLGVSDPHPDPSIIKLKIVRKPLISTVLRLLYDFTNVPDPQDPCVFGPSGSVRLRY
jgi:hypothetical protein